ncbi:MAG: ATP-binding protein [Sedimentibacter sp.]
MKENLLTNLIIYRNLYYDEIINKYTNLYSKFLNNQTQDDYSKDYYDLCSYLIYNGYNSANDYISRKIILDENIFSLSCEKGIKINDMVRKATLHDISILKKLSELSSSLKGISGSASDVNNFINYNNTESLTDIFNNNRAEDIYKYLNNEYTVNGCGEYRNNYAFSINEEGYLTPVYDFNPVVMENIFGYERQKSKVIENTQKFISGRNALNTLLVGDSGTGKSTTVKALIPMFKNKKLRLIEVEKEKLNYIPKIVENLKNRGIYFIIFIDDLSFETNEDSYKYLKSVVEGSIYEQPNNILFYVTSNRKQLIKENLVERQNEVHVRDAINEQTSLSDRFGLTILYDEANQDEYFNIVLGLANEYGLEYDNEFLLAEAKKFAYQNGGRTGRTAIQFIKTFN